jgi:hypothetical protein
MGGLSSCGLSTNANQRFEEKKISMANGCTELNGKILM